MSFVLQKQFFFFLYTKKTKFSLLNNLHYNVLLGAILIITMLGLLCVSYRQMNIVTCDWILFVNMATIPLSCSWLLALYYLGLLLWKHLGKLWNALGSSPLRKEDLLMFCFSEEKIYSSCTLGFYTENNLIISYTNSGLL